MSRRRQDYPMEIFDEPTAPSPEDEEAAAPRRLANWALACGLAGVVLPVLGLAPALWAVGCGWRALRLLSGESTHSADTESSRSTGTEPTPSADAAPSLWALLTLHEGRLGVYFSGRRGRALVGFALGIGGLGIQGGVVYLAFRYWI